MNCDIPKIYVLTGNQEKPGSTEIIEKKEERMWDYGDVDSWKSGRSQLPQNTREEEKTELDKNDS